MKKIFTPLLLAAVVSFAGCNKKNLLDIKFGMNAKEIEFTSPAAPNPGEMNFLIQKLEYNLDSLAKANNVNLSQIKSIKVKEAFIDIVDPDQPTLTFDAVDFAEAYCSVDGKPEIKIAAKNPIAKDHVRSIKLDIIGEELVSYLKSSSAQFRLRGKTNTPINSPVKMKARFSFDVVANPTN